MQTLVASAERAAALAAWLDGIGFRLRDVRPLPGDVSLRRYARLIAASGDTAILAAYPPDLRAVCGRFAQSTAIFAAAGIAVPEVMAASCEHGWMLLQDLGTRTLADLWESPWTELSDYFQDAAGIAARIARLPAETVRALNPALDASLLALELAQTRDVFLEPEGLLRERQLADALAASLEPLCADLAADSPRPCHRDFMTRNLMPLAAGRVAVLDHQDLRLGPSSYDLASLLNDTLFPPPELERALLAAFFPQPEDRLRYHRAAAQRTLKAVGSYAAFARRGSDRHLPLIAPTLRRFLAHFARLPEGADLAPALERAWRVVLG